MSIPLPPSPGSPTHAAIKPSPKGGKRPLTLKVHTLPVLGPTASSEYASESEGQSPEPLSSEPSSGRVPTLFVESPQSSTYHLSPKFCGRSDERSGHFPSPTRSNSLMSEAGGGFEEWRCDQPFQFEIPKPKEDPWEGGYMIAREHDREMCEAWREAVDKLLIFAGLFSAALVAFLTISCPMLNADPNEIQNALLLRISVQLEFLSGANNITTAIPPLPSPESAFRPSSTVIVTNMCWFFSLTVSLGTVLFGTVCLQWIREFQRDPHLGFKEAFEFRQMRFEGLMNWGIPFIISSLPLLLQLSLLLFFLGLSFFLQSYDPLIAAAISVLIALIVVFLCVTMMLPAMQCLASSSKRHDQRSSLCPFKSPHGRLFGVFAASSFLCFINVLEFFSGNHRVLARKREFLDKIVQSRSSWTSLDMAWLETSCQSPKSAKDDCPHSPVALAWLASTYGPSHDALGAFYHCLRDIDSSTARVNTLQRLASVTSTTDFNWTFDYDVKHSKDIQSALALDHFVTASPQLHDSLLSHRVELFVRILNQDLMISKMGRPGQTADAVGSMFQKGLLVPFSRENDNDFVVLETACKLQLIRTFLSYLEEGENHDFLADIVIKMIHKTMTTKPLTSDKMLRDELFNFNKKLNAHLNDKACKYNVKELVQKYVDKFGGNGYTGSRFPNFKTSFVHLAEQVQRP